MSIYKRGSAWYACYTDESGKLVRKSLGTTDEREAKEKFRDIEKRLWMIEQGLMEPKGKHKGRTLEDAYKRALQVHYKTPTKLHEATFRWKLLVRTMDEMKRLQEADPEKHEHILQPTTPLADIGRLLADDVRAVLLGLKVPRANTTYSDATANRTLAFLSCLLNLAVKWEWLQSAPRMPKTDEHGRERVLTDAEIATMWQAIRDSGKPKWVAGLDLFTTLHHQALRLSEATKLKWSQVDLEAGTMTLLKATTKGKKAVTKPLTPEVLAILKSRSERGLEQPFSDVTAYTIQEAWNYGLKVAGLEGEGIVRHTLRHSAATKLIEQGHDVSLVKEYLGHRSIQTTMRYVHADHRALQSLAKTLGGCVSSVSVDPSEVAQN